MANCPNLHPGTPTVAQSQTALELSWINIFDYYTGGDPTTWIQQCINLAKQMQIPLYFPPTSGGIPAPYAITGGLSISGAGCHLFGPVAQSSFAQAGGPDYDVTGSTRAMIWTTGLDYDMMCIDVDHDVNVLIENIDFCVVPVEESPPTGNACLHIYNNGAQIDNATLYGPMNGVHAEDASGVRLRNVTIIPYASEVTGRYGVLCSSDPGDHSSPGPVDLQNFVLDQTQQPFTGPPGLSAILHTVDGVVAQSNYASLTFDTCTIIAADNGFATISGSTGGVTFYSLLNSEAYNCNVGVNLEDLGFGVVENCRVTVDNSANAPSASPLYGVVATTGVQGALVLRNNVIAGNGSSAMVGIALEGPAPIAVLGGAIVNCGPQSPGISGDGLFIEAPAGAQYTVGGIVISGCADAGLHFGEDQLGSAVVANLLLADNVNGATSQGAGVLIDELGGVPSGIVIVDCVFAGNSVDVLNANSAVSTTAEPLPIKLANNTGYNPTGPLSGVPSPSAGVPFVNNTGVDQSVYLGAAGISPLTGVGISNISPTGSTTGGIDPVLSTYIVAAGASITLSGTGAPSSWTWIGN